MEVIIERYLFPSTPSPIIRTLGTYRFKFDTVEKPKWDCFSKDTLLSFRDMLFPPCTVQSYDSFPNPGTSKASQMWLGPGPVAGDRLVGDGRGGAGRPKNSFIRFPDRAQGPGKNEARAVSLGHIRTWLLGNTLYCPHLNELSFSLL